MAPIPAAPNFQEQIPQAAEGGVMDAGWEGFSMEEARKHAEAQSTKMANRTPAEVLQDLQRGNTRFWTGISQRPEASAFERRALLTKQFPSVAVLGCADSRVPVEIVFDMGLGDMFVVRVAGNAVDTMTLASLQYAVHHLKVKVLLVMGHEGCGAVKAAGLADADIDKEPESLGRLLRTLKSGLDYDRLKHVHDKRALDRESVVSNATEQVDKIIQDPGIMRKVRSQELIIVGAFYEISSGIVDFFHEVAEGAGEVVVVDDPVIEEDGWLQSPVVHPGVAQEGVDSPTRRSSKERRSSQSPHIGSSDPRLLDTPFGNGEANTSSNAFGGASPQEQQQIFAQQQQQPEMQQQQMMQQQQLFEQQQQKEQLMQQQLFEMQQQQPPQLQQQMSPQHQRDLLMQQMLDQQQQQQQQQYQQYHRQPGAAQAKSMTAPIARRPPSREASGPMPGSMSLPMRSPRAIQLAAQSGSPPPQSGRSNNGVSNAE